MRDRSGGDRARVLSLACWLAAAWLLWSGRSEGLLLAFGAVSLGLVLWLALRMDLVDEESEPYHLGWRPLVYVPWLVGQIALANLHVARAILSPRLPIRPRLLRVRASQRTDLGRAVHANSITLTPGTLALDVRDGQILVHALTDASAAGLESGEMDRRVTWLEGGA